MLSSPLVSIILYYILPVLGSIPNGAGTIGVSFFCPFSSRELETST